MPVVTTFGRDPRGNWTLEELRPSQSLEFDVAGLDYVQIDRGLGNHKMVRFQGAPGRYAVRLTYVSGCYEGERKGVFRGPLTSNEATFVVE
jgi:hypothetical protein